MKILHITTSPRGGDSVSYRLSQRVIDHLLVRHPAALIIARDLAAEPPPHVDGQYASARAAGMRAPGCSRPSAIALRKRV